MNSEYSDIHRGFLQFMMSRGSISEDSAQNVLAELFTSNEEGVPSEGDLEKIVDAINVKIRMFDQKIDIVTSMYDDKVFVVFLNTTQSAIMKLQATYKPAEIEFFRLIIKEISLADDHSMPTISVLNLMNQNRNKDFSMSKSEKMLKDWIEEGYFYSRGGVMYLGVRAVAEFGEFIKSKFNVDCCHLCKAILLKGVDCNGDTCDGHFHMTCIRKYIIKTAKCPKCKKQWDVCLT